MQRRRIARGRMKNPKRIDEIQILHNHLLIHHQTMMELKKDRASIMMIMTVLAMKNQRNNFLQNQKGLTRKRLISLTVKKTQGSI